ncbi:MAG: isoprenylcysteine carboxylmethyltransferase family protein [Bacteroidota bacterium]
MTTPNDWFRPARSKNSYWNLIKTLFQTAVFWFIFLYLLPSAIYFLEETYKVVGYSPPRMLSIALLILFSFLGLWSGVIMSWQGKGTPLPTDCPNQLVIQGPYHYVRNPMAVAGIGQGVAVGLLFGSYLIVAYAIAGAFLWHWLVRPVEEKDLLDRFGKAYIAYQAKVKCWIPSFWSISKRNR